MISTMTVIRAALMSGVCASLACFPTAVMAQTQAQASALDPTGDWRGMIDLGAVKLRLALHLGAQSTFDSPDQGANGLPAQMTADGAHVVVALRGAGQFEGTLSADGKTLKGTLKQGPGAFPVTFERGAFTVANRPQTPRPPFPYKVEEVAYDNAAQPGVHLAGTLTTPDGTGPFPAVILITGSGAQDRDETLFEHKPFLVLADALTRRGIAVLRVDDRGVGGSRGVSESATTADFASDVAAGVTWLRGRKDIDRRRIGLLGHSEGGLIAPIVASRDPAIGFIVLWAGPGVSGKEVVIDQARALARAAGAGDEAAQRNADLQRAVLDALIATPDAAAAKAAMNAAMASGGGPSVSDAAVATMTSPWYRYFLALDPAVALREVKVPVLALLGGKDTQVSPALNEGPLRAALAGNAKARLEVLPGLNHLFQLAGSGAPTEYATIEQTIDPSALDHMVDWIVGVTQRKR